MTPAPHLHRAFVQFVVVVVVGAATMTGCSGDTRLATPLTAPTVAQDTRDTGATTISPGTPGTPGTTPTGDVCRPDDPTRSFAPGPMPAPGQMPAGSTMAAIQARRKLRVGVSADTLLFGARNPITGDIEGFDIDVLNRIAAAIFGPPAQGAKPNSQLDITVITYAQRLPVLTSRRVDLVAHTMTINCARWQQIAFSTEYFAAGQKVLVNKGSPYESIDDLTKAGATVCAPDGSTNLEEVSKPQYRNLKVITRPDVTDCLAAMQQGRADAATGDDTVLAGFVAQDPNTRVAGDQFTKEPYGIGVNAGQRDLVAFVNGVLQEMRTDPSAADSLTGLYRRWLAGNLEGPVPTPPVAQYFA